MRDLAALEDPRLREANERHGDDHGVNLTRLRALAKRLKTQHELALQLWATGNTAARLLATLVCNSPHPERRALARPVPAGGRIPAREPRVLDRPLRPGRHRARLHTRARPPTSRQSRALPDNPPVARAPAGPRELASRVGAVPEKYTELRHRRWARSRPRTCASRRTESPSGFMRGSFMHAFQRLVAGGLVGPDIHEKTTFSPAVGLDGAIEVGGLALRYVVAPCFDDAQRHRTP